MGSNNDVIRDWAKGKVRRIASCTIKADEQALYSYGEHFPLVVRNPSGLKLGNGDRYSTTTAGHQSSVRHLVDVLVPFQGLQRFRLSAFNDWIELVDRQPDSYQEVTGKRLNPETNKMEDYTYQKHFLGGCLLRAQKMEEDGNKVGEPHMFVCGWDATGVGHNGIYFMSELRHHANTYEEAIELLKPSEVLLWEKKTGQEAQRQGEWFFIPADINPQSDEYRLGEEVVQMNRWKSREYRKVLVNTGQGTGHHTADQIIIDRSNRQFVRGRIVHQLGEHRVIRLTPKNQWFRAIENTAITSVGLGGNVD